MSPNGFELTKARRFVKMQNSISNRIVCRSKIIRKFLRKEGATGRTIQLELSCNSIGIDSANHSHNVTMIVVSDGLERSIQISGIFTDENDFVSSAQAFTWKFALELISNHQSRINGKTHSSSLLRNIRSERTQFDSFSCLAFSANQHI